MTNHPAIVSLPQALWSFAWTAGEPCWKDKYDAWAIQEIHRALARGPNSQIAKDVLGLVPYRPDLLIANGHVFPEIDKKNIDIRFKARRILYRNLRDGRFEDISAQAGPGILAEHSSRGVAVGDIDSNGVLEILINNQGEPPSLLKPMSRPPGNWVSLQLTGTRSNRSAIGAKVRLTAGGITQTQEVRSGGGFISQNDLRLHFGLGSAQRLDSVQIEWPSGSKEERRGLEINRTLNLKEPEAMPPR